MADIEKLRNAHLEEFGKTAHINSMEEYKRLYRRSIENPDEFWADQAKTYLSWDKIWDFVLRYDFEEAKIEWFGGGVLNACHNCIDRHLELRKDKIAYYWVGDSPGETRSVTYSDLHAQVCKLAAELKYRGVNKGDRVILYMPRVIELPVAMLACARIGAIHSVVFGGFSPKALANRISDCNARVIITVDSGFRSGKLLAYKTNVVKALEIVSDVETVIVFDRTGQKKVLSSSREIGWHEAFVDPDLTAYVAPEPMNAEDPLFILYTSGPSGKPVGIVHTHGGYLLYAAMSSRIIFDLREDDVIWCTADFGWIMGHSLGVYGSLLNGQTSVIFEGVPWYPTYDRYWEIISKYRVTKFYTAPTVIRMLSRAGNNYPKKYDLSSLRLLGSAGEILDPESWEWFYSHVGYKRCPIVDTYFQIETGGPVISPLPGISPSKPGSCSIPFFGTDPVILDDSGEEAKYPNQRGVLCIRDPWPGIARTVHGDHEQFISTYFTQIPGMFFTADEAMRDEDGNYRIIGRVDNVINVSGHRLGTKEIESVLELHDQVIEAAAVGFPHPIKRQGIYAFVAIKDISAISDALKNELISLVRQEIGPIATIDVIQWTTALPKTRSGKILRTVLEKIAAGKTDEIGNISGIADPSLIESLIKNHKPGD